MVGIYKNEVDMPFTGIVAESEDAAWKYLDKTYGRYIQGYGWAKCSRRKFVLLPIICVTKKGVIS